jgi:L-threonylcarbamoyladenylate synthase
MAQRFAIFSPLAEKLAKAFWPGPLTLVLPRRENCGLSLLVSAGLDTIALRAPNHAFARQLLQMCDRPLAAPSANRSGSVSPTTAEHVRDSLGDRIRFILDGGACPVGVESTIVKVDGARAILLRPGGVPRAAIETIAGVRLESAGGAVEAPGMLESHYAPQSPLRLNVAEPASNEAYLGFGKFDGEGARVALNLSAGGDLIEAAANLFAHLRSLDAICSERSLIGIAAAPVPGDDLGEAINDRLKRAAAPRS